MKKYQQTKFLPKEFNKFYFSNKALFILKSFAKDFQNKLSDTSLDRLKHHSKDLTYYSLVPQDL